MCASTSDALMSSNSNPSTTARGRNRVINRSSSGSSYNACTAAPANNNNNTTTNPIGVSRLRQSPKQHDQPIVPQSRERRSQSLTRFVSNNIVGGSGSSIGGTDRGGVARRRRSFQQQQQPQPSSQMEEQPLQAPDLPSSGSSSHRQRSISLSSFHTAAAAASTELLHEPGWFSHAFHGSGACTCSLLLGSHHAEDHHPTPIVAVHNEDNDMKNNGAPQVDYDDSG